ncbi:hypothetical protein GCM10008941_08980 [Rhizomicrobium palustre]
MLAGAEERARGQIETQTVKIHYRFAQEIDHHPHNRAQHGTEENLRKLAGAKQTARSKYPEDAAKKPRSRRLLRAVAIIKAHIGSGPESKA